MIELALLLLVIVVVIVGVAIVLRQRTGAPERSQPAPEEAEPANLRVLLGMVLGDQAKAERLIELERTRTPQGSRSELIDQAIDRLRADLSR